MHNNTAPSGWIQRWSHLVPAQSSVLDVACGTGRHLRWFHQRGHVVTGVDRSQESTALLQPLGEVVCADIENRPWPFADRTFGAVVVTNYLWRPLLPLLVASVAPGGVLLYETFAAGNEAIGRPARPEFLLRPGELLQVCKSLRIVAYEDGFAPAPDRVIQRIAALRESEDSGSPTPPRLQPTL